MKSKNKMTFEDFLASEIDKEIKSAGGVKNLIDEIISEITDCCDEDEKIDTTKAPDIIFEETVTRTTYSGKGLINAISEGKVKECDIEVYKNKKYLFSLKCGEKAILDNPMFHIGMITSQKYTYVVSKKINDKIIVR